MTVPRNFEPCREPERPKTRELKSESMVAARLRPTFSDEIRDDR